MVAPDRCQASRTVNDKHYTRDTQNCIITSPSTISWATTTTTGEYCNNDSQFMANSQPVKMLPIIITTTKNALSKQTQPSCVAPPGLVNGSRALNATASSNTGPKKNHTNAFQPCHIMKKPNSYALLKQQEKESRSHLRARNNQSTLKLQSRQGMSYQKSLLAKHPSRNCTETDPKPP